MNGKKRFTLHIVPTGNMDDFVDSGDALSKMLESGWYIVRADATSEGIVYVLMSYKNE